MLCTLTTVIDYLSFNSFIFVICVVSILIPCLPFVPQIFIKVTFFYILLIGIFCHTTKQFMCNAIYLSFCLWQLRFLHCLGWPTDLLICNTSKVFFFFSLINACNLINVRQSNIWQNLCSLGLELSCYVSLGKLQSCFVAHFFLPIFPELWIYNMTKYVDILEAK